MKLEVRMHFVEPKEGERYYLRLILTRVKGATSYQELKIVDGIYYKTFKQACVALGLLDDGKDLDECLNEASNIQTGKQLRHLFSLILSNCEILNGYQLWLKYQNHLCEDILNQFKKSSNDNSLQLNEEIINVSLLDLERNLNNVGQTLENFPEFPKLITETNGKIEAFINSHKNYDTIEMEETCKNNILKFNEDQLSIYNTIVHNFNNDNSTKSRLFFIDGPGGCGKTYLYNTLLAKVRSTNSI
jgi:hypothetical protein